MNKTLGSSTPYNGFAVLTPYIIPASMQGKKVRNLGDGFILRAIERFIGPFDVALTFTPRTAPSERVWATLQEKSAVILAGANQLSETYTIWPGLSADRICEGRLRFVPFGIGLHEASDGRGRMSAETRAVLEAVHDRIDFSSWRCPRTVAFLQRELPHRAGQFLMTGCPVLYDHPLLDSRRFSRQEAEVAVTATERGDFWKRETAVLDVVSRRFSRSNRYFVTHQNFSPPSVFEGIRHQIAQGDPATVKNQTEALRLYARGKGFQIVTPRDADECSRFYERMDVHVGTRLHAHLLFLSRNKRSYLVPIDERPLGMADYFGFPLSSPGQLDENWECDFELVRERAREGFTVMERFVRSLKKLQTIHLSSTNQQKAVVLGM